MTRCFRLCLLLWPLGLVLGAGSALAARPARIDVEEAPLYEQLTPGSNVIRTITRGTRVVVSNVPLQGFYKARTNEGEIGWISEKAVQVLERPTEEEVEEANRRRKELQQENEDRARAAEDAAWDEEAEQQKHTVMTVDPTGREVVEESSAPTRHTPHHWRLSGFIGFTEASLAAVKSLTGEAVPTLATNYGLELEYKYNRKAFPYILRIEGVKASGVVADPGTLQVYNMTAQGTPIMLGSRLELVDSKGFSMDIALFLGIAFNESFQTQILSQDSPNTVTMSANAFAALIKADFNVQLSDDWFIFLELGYRSLRSGTATFDSASSGANGNGIVMRNGNLTGVQIDLSGMLASLGLSWTF